MTRISRRWFWIIFPFLLISSCSHPEKKDFGGTLRIGSFYTPTEINPLTTDSSVSANLLDLIFDTLIRISPEEKVLPALADHWEISPDYLNLTFYLRKDVKFHDGSPLTAEDVAFTYKTLKESKKTGYASPLIYVKDIKVLNPHTLQLSLLKPDHSLWGGLGLYGIAPKKILESDPQYKNFNQHPIGSGPFRFVSQNEKEILLEANPQYFGGRPYLDKILVKILPSQTACLSHLIAEKIDLVFLLNPEDYGALSQIPSIRIYQNWDPIFYMIIFNRKNPLFGSPKVRTALNEAVHREAILQKVLDGKGRMARGTLPPESFESKNQNLEFSYQPKRALEMLKSEGWGDDNHDFILDKGNRNFEFNIMTMSGDPITAKTLSLVQSQLQNLGIKVTVSIFPFKDHIEHIAKKRDFDTALINIVSTRFYDLNYAFWHSSQIDGGLNFASYSNAELDQILENQRFGINPDQISQTENRLQEILYKDPPGIFLFWRQMPIAIQSRFRGVPEKKMESFRDFVHFWIPKEEQKEEIH